MIELLVVIALMGIIGALAAPGITSYFQLSLSSATREMASTFKEAYNSAVVTGNVYRMVYDLKTGEYWVESGPANTLLDTKASLEKAAERKRMASINDKAPESPFHMDVKVTRKKLSLPSGASFEDVITQQSKEPITEGTAYTHFFPAGMGEQTLIHLKDQSNHHVTLAILPILGRTDKYDRYVGLEEAFGKL